MALFVEVGVNDVLQIDGTTVVLERKTGSRARLRIIGPADVKLLRNQREQQQDPQPQRMSADPKRSTHG